MFLNFLGSSFSDIWRKKSSEPLNITKAQVNKSTETKCHRRPSKRSNPHVQRRRINLCWIPNVFLLAVDLLASIQPTLSWSLFFPLPPSARRAGGRPHTHLQAEAIQEGQELWYMQAGHHQGGPHLQRWVPGMLDSAGSLTLNLSRREIRMSDLWPDSGQVKFLERMRERFIHENVLLIPVQDGWRGWGLSQHAIFPVLYVNSLFSCLNLFQALLLLLWWHCWHLLRLFLHSCPPKKICYQSNTFCQWHSFLCLFGHGGCSQSTASYKNV